MFQASQGTNQLKITDTAAFPLFGGMDISFINLLLAFGALVALPSIPDIIARTVGRMGVAGQLIGQEIGGSYGAGQRYAGQFQQGPTGLAGQVGRVPSEAGLIYDTTSRKWRRPTSAYEATLVSRGGQFQRARAGLGGLINRFRRP